MTKTFAEFVARRFGGKLTHGSHTPDGAACYQEAVRAYRGLPWGDGAVDDAPSFISLNDAPWSSDDVRTDAMLPLHVVTLGWASWSPAKRQKWAKRVAKEAIKQILPPTLRALAERVPSVAPDLIAAALRCETEGTESAARSAAWSARSARSADVALQAFCAILVEAAR